MLHYDTDSGTLYILILHCHMLLTSWKCSLCSLAWLKVRKQNFSHSDITINLPSAVLYYSNISWHS